MVGDGGRKKNTSQICADKRCLVSKTCNQTWEPNEEEDNTIEETEDVSQIQSLTEKKEKFMIQHSVRGFNNRQQGRECGRNDRRQPVTLAFNRDKGKF